MGLIETAIPTRSYEVIRDRVGAILALELPSQATLHVNPDLDVSVYVERSKPVHPDETTIVNVSIQRGDFDYQSVMDSEGSFQIAIDCVCSGETTANQRGDVAAAFRTQKLGGVIMGILEHPIYKYLGFTPPFINYSQTTGFEVGEPDRSEANNISVFRVMLVVRASQKEGFQTGTLLTEALSQVHIGETDQGYLYTYQS